jgi:lysophospholipase L1-like esterase
MIKRFIVLTVALALLVASVNTGVVAAHGPTHGVSDQPPTSEQDMVWQGMWAGANFVIINSTTVISNPNVNGTTKPYASHTSTSNTSKYASTASSRSSTSPSTSTAPATPPPTNQNLYVALGDSIAAGAGLPAGAAATQTDTKCKRSPLAYPNWVAQAQGMTLLHLACSGAKTSDVNRSKQLKAAFASGTPRLISITAGANDAQWVAFLKKCYSTRCGTESDTRIVAAYQKALQSRLHKLLLNISLYSGDRPPIVVLTGYYNPLSTNCSAIEPRFSTLEMAWVSEQLGILNKTIEDASAQYQFAKFAPISFAGHDVCSSDPWVQGRADNAPFHPTAEGQQVIANQVLRVL